MLIPSEKMLPVSIIEYNKIEAYLRLDKILGKQNIDLHNWR